MKKLTFNVLGLSNAITSPEFCTNPFVHNTLGMCTMLKNAGHIVRHFGSEGSVVDCTEHFDMVKRSELEETYGKSFHLQKRDLNTIQESYTAELYHARAKQTLKKVAKKGEFLLSMAGPPQQAICDELTEHGLHVVEPAVGYGVGFCRHRVFPSYAWMHYAYSEYDGNWNIFSAEFSEEEKVNPDNYLTIAMPMWYLKPCDAVIPHYIYPDEFEVSADGHDDYLLQVSRIIPNKGIEMAVRVAQHLGRKLIIAGHGDFKKSLGFDPPKCVELVGPVLNAERKKLMQRAYCMMAWTHYIEAFGLSAVESMFSGRPVITSNWGAFAETNLHGVSGYKTPNLDSPHDTFRQTCDAVEKAGELKAEDIRQYAMDHFSIDAITPLHDAYFQRLHKYITAQEKGEGFFHLI